MRYLKLRLYLLLGVLFGIIYAAASMISHSLGIANFYFYLVLSFVLMFIQYLIGPKIVEWSMRVKYVDKTQYPELHGMVEELSDKAKIPKPKVGVAQIQLPNAFAFGKSLSDGRICVTTSILNLLNEDELRAVLAHEDKPFKES